MFGIPHLYRDGGWLSGSRISPSLLWRHRDDGHGAEHICTVPPLFKKRSTIPTASRKNKCTVQTAKALQESLKEIGIKWVSSQVGIRGNEEARQLDTRTLHDSTLKTRPDSFTPLLLPYPRRATTQQQKSWNTKIGGAHSLHFGQGNCTVTLPNHTRFEAAALRRQRTNTSINSPKLSLFKHIEHDPGGIAIPRGTHCPTGRAVRDPPGLLKDAQLTYFSWLFM